MCLVKEELKKMPDVAAVCMEVCMEAFKVEMSKKRDLEVKLKKVEEKLKEAEEEAFDMVEGLFKCPERSGIMYWYTMFCKYIDQV